MKLPFPVVQCAIDANRRVPLPLQHWPVCTLPTTDPDHTVYGKLMLDLWHLYASEYGLLWCEADVAPPLEALQELESLVAEDSTRVVAVPFRLYPASTKQDRVVWPHYFRDGNGELKIVQLPNPPPREPLSFGLGCTYLPRRLLELASPKLPDWDWPILDWRLSMLALDEGVSIITTLTEAVHLHY